MKQLKESFIKAKDLDNLNNKWPNPYDLTKEDAKGKIKGFPLEIITLILHEIYLENDVHKFDLKDLQDFGLEYAFLWDDSQDGLMFWEKINNEEFDVFYDAYTPSRLKERLKEKKISK